MSNSSSWHPSEDSQQSIQDFATLLQLQLQRGHYDLDTETLADIFWLARYIGTSSSPLVINKSQLAKVSPTTNQSEQEVFNPQSEDVIVDLPKEAPVAIQPTQVEHPTSQTSFGVGLPLQIPAASALRSQLELSRALRPLMRRIPSPTQTLLDEEATRPLAIFISRCANAGFHPLSSQR